MPIGKNPNSLKNLEATKFKKGQSGNPDGARKHNPIKRTIKRLTLKELKDLSCLLLDGDVEALKRIAKDPKTRSIKAMVASVAYRIVVKGDAQALNILLDRLVGKVPSPVRVSGHDGGPVESVNVVIGLPSNGRESKL